MIDHLMDIALDAASSPWFYLAIWAFAVLDSFFPIVPSETLVITAGVFAASGTTNLALVIAAAAIGAFVGDHISYFIGRTAGTRLSGKENSARRKAFDWASRALETRGGLLLVVARYVPGGRTAATITMGAVEYPLARFSAFDAIAAISWALYCGYVGFIGGKAFEEDPIKGLLLGFGIAFTITVVTEIVRYLRRDKSVQLPAERPV
ncbi:MAG: DedA family protein [Corynebacteriales bacterium]|nr:DedA family protein [Mycobacteriales bacterium]